MRHHTVIVAGVPVGQGNMKGYNVNGTVRVVHKNASKLEIWRTTIADAIGRQLGEELELMTGPLWISAAFRLPRPRKIPKENKGYPIGKLSGDADHYLRALGDALTGVLIDDDSRIVHVKDLTKTYANPGAQPGVVFTVGEVAESAEIIELREAKKHGNVRRAR